MCGRFTLLAEARDLEKKFHIPHPIQLYEKSYNVSPGQRVLAVIHDGCQRRAGYIRWGLVPSWAKDKKKGYKMINARSETAHEKLSFKQLMGRKRCLIIADSFYEWRKGDSLKQPERIELKEKRPFAFAGLWDQWKQSDEVLFTCTLLTKESNEFMQSIHHRMPIILPEDKEAGWIDPALTDPLQAYEFLQTIQTEPLTSYQVGSYVNKASHNDPLCIRPAQNETLF